MNTIGVIGAMETEVELLKGSLTDCEQKEFAHTSFFVGQYCGKRLVVACSGIGKVNAACTSQIMIDRFGVDCVINTGIAGGLSGKVAVGDVVVSKTMYYHDFELRFLTYRYPFTERFDADAVLVEAAKRACTAAGISRLFVEDITTGDAFVTDSALKKDIVERASTAYCVEMEGAAIAHACAINDVPFVVIRTISDNADDNAEFSFEQFAEKTAQISSRLVLAMAGELK